MAVMTSDGLTLEQKTLPVPSSSSDEMALDLEINGTSHRDGIAGDVAPSNTESIVPKPVTSSPSSPSPVNDPPSDSLMVNGALNNAAFASNISVPTGSLEQSPVESSPQLPDTFTTTTTDEEQTKTQPESSLDDLSAILSPADAAIVTAVADTSVISTLPPAVDATESGLRDSTVDHPIESATETPSLPSIPVEPAVEEVSASNPPVESAPASEQADQLSNLDLNSITDAPAAEQIASHLNPAQTSPVDDIPSEAPADSVMHTEQDEAEQNTSTSLDTTAALNDDVDMMDVPQYVPSKVREREDDEDDERSVKRTKTGVDTSASAATTNGVSSGRNSQSAKVKSEPSQSDGRPITRYVEKEVIKHLKNAARTADGKHFKDSVAVLWPAFAVQYAEKIENPIDFAMMEQKVRANAYPSLNELKDDLRLLRANAFTFNGIDNPIAQSSVKATQAVLEKIDAIPPDPAPIPKPQKKAKAATPIGDMASRAPQARRQSRGGGTSADAAPAQTFALDPHSNTPLIRRDSTKGDGRPKREIHPPKNKDLSYARPKSKKFATELRWCEEVLAEIRKPKYADFVYPFLHPVDPVAQGIPTYFSVIKTPMDISKVAENLQAGNYATSKDFEKDMYQIYTNCFRFNPPGNMVHDMGRRFENLWKDQLAKKSKWVTEHAPAAASVSPNLDSDEEESDNEPPPPPQVPVTSDASTAATKRLVEEQEKLITLISTPNTDPSIIEMQRAMIKVVKDQIEKEVTAAAALVSQNAKKSKKSKLPSKPNAPVQQSSKKKGTVTKKPSSHKSGAQKKDRYMGTMEKEVISAGIATLPDAVSAQVLKLIQDGQPDIDEGDDGTVELDIDAIPTGTLWKIYELIKTHTPEIERSLRQQFQERDAPRASTKQAPKKKNKPMNKYEQDRKIAHLQNQMQTFERGNSGSQEPIPTVEDHGNESSGDEDSDSEEE